MIAFCRAFLDEADSGDLNIAPASAAGRKAPGNPTNSANTQLSDGWMLARRVSEWSRPKSLAHASGYQFALTRDAPAG